MSNDSRDGVAGEALRVGADTIELRMRERIRATIEEIVEEELAAALGAGPSPVTTQAVNEGPVTVSG